MLLEKGADVKHGEGKQVSLLMEAAFKGDATIVDEFLAKGADPKAIDPDSGQTPLHYAVRGANPTIVEKLVAKGADLNAKDKAGQTPLKLAKELSDPAHLFVVPSDKKDFSGVTAALKKLGATE